MTYETLQLTVDDAGVAHLTLHRPDAANAIDLPMGRDLMAATLALHGNPEVRAVLLSGSGNTFCAGGDLRAFAAQGDALPGYIKELTSYLHVAVAHLTQLDAPVVAAVHGSAAGAGLSLALGADLVVAAHSAKFVMAYTKAGVAPDGGSTWFLPRIVGLRHALDLTLTNRLLSAADALALGIVSRVVNDDDLAEEAGQLAAQLADGPTATLGEAKRLLRLSSTNGLETQLELESRAIAAAVARHDGREGIAAFLGKRRPDFRAR